MKARQTTLRLSFGAAAAALVLLGGNAVAAGSKDDAATAVLAQKSGCLACHRGAGKGNGPAYKDVAEKYAGNKNAEALLVKHITAGTGPNGLGWMQAGKASLTFMPANQVSSADARKLARWVLATTGEIADVSRLFVTESISISGLVKNKLNLDPAALRGLRAGSSPG